MLTNWSQSKSCNNNGFNCTVSNSRRHWQKTGFTQTFAALVPVFVTRMSYCIFIAYCVLQKINNCVLQKINKYSFDLFSVPWFYCMVVLSFFLLYFHHWWESDEMANIIKERIVKRLQQRAWVLPLVQQRGHKDVSFIDRSSLSQLSCKVTSENKLPQKSQNISNITTPHLG